MNPKAILSTVVFSLVTTLFAVPSVTATAGADPIVKASASNIISLNRVMSPTDPNRKADWDWITDRTVVLHALSETETGVIDRPVRLPYYDRNSEAGELVDENGPDIRREDGWVLLYRDFGTPTIGVQTPFFILQL